MEIKITHHPAQENIARQIGNILTENGITSQIEKNGHGVKILVKEEAISQTNPTESSNSYLSSSFVYIDSQPGY